MGMQQQQQQQVPVFTPAPERQRHREQHGTNVTATTMLPEPCSLRSACGMDIIIEQPETCIGRAEKTTATLRAGSTSFREKASGYDVDDNNDGDHGHHRHRLRPSATENVKESFHYNNFPRTRVALWDRTPRATDGSGVARVVATPECVLGGSIFMCTHAYAGIKRRADALRDGCEKRSLLAHTAHRLRGEFMREGIVLREAQDHDGNTDDGDDAPGCSGLPRDAAGREYVPVRFEARKGSDHHEEEVTMSAAMARRIGSRTHRLRSSDAAEVAISVSSDGRPGDGDAAWAPICHVSISMPSSLVVTLTPLLPLRVCSVALHTSLMRRCRWTDGDSVDNLYESTSGYLSMDQARKLLPIAEDDERAYTLPLVGIWVLLDSSSSRSNGLVAAAALRFATHPHIIERAGHGDGCFLMQRYIRGDASPELFEVKVDCRRKGASTSSSSPSSFSLPSSSKITVEDVAMCRYWIEVPEPPSDATTGLIACERRIDDVHVDIAAEEAAPVALPPASQEAISAPCPRVHAPLPMSNAAAAAAMEVEGGEPTTRLGSVPSPAKQTGRCRPGDGRGGGLGETALCRRGCR